MYRVWSKNQNRRVLGYHFCQGLKELLNPRLGCFMKSCGRAWYTGRNVSDPPPPACSNSYLLEVVIHAGMYWQSMSICTNVFCVDPCSSNAVSFLKHNRLK